MLLKLLLYNLLHLVAMNVGIYWSDGNVRINITLSTSTGLSNQPDFYYSSVSSNLKALYKSIIIIIIWQKSAGDYHHFQYRYCIVGSIVPLDTL